MTPNISPHTAILYNTRILHGKTDRLTEDELRSRITLIQLCSILEPCDPPSASCLPPTRISEYHANWLRTLPNFSLVGYLNVENSYYTGEKVLRLYLLADWLETREATAVRDTQLSESTERWIIERVRWYRLRRRLMDQYEIGETTAQAQLESHRASLTCRYEQAREAVGLLLNMLGFNAEITTEDRAFYDKAMLSASATNPGHAFKNILDFTGMP